METLLALAKLVPAVMALAKAITALIREGVEVKKIAQALEGMSAELNKVKETKDTSGLENMFRPTDPTPE